MSNHTVETAPCVALLLDDRYLARKAHVRRTFHEPTKLAENPVLDGQSKPWAESPLIFGSVRYDPYVGKYRMWHAAYNLDRSQPRADRTSVLAVAESRDGLHWRRPKLDVIPAVVDGKAHKSPWVFASTPGERYIELGSVLILPDNPEAKRYVLIYCAVDLRTNEKIYRLAFSPDGLHWRRAQRVPLPKPGKPDRHCMLRDPESGEFLLFCRGQKPIRKGFPTCEGVQRTVCLQTSTDLKTWSDLRLVVAADDRDPVGSNIYSHMPFFRGRTLVGVYQLHNEHKDIETVRTRLAWSHDRVTWQRRREDFIPLGEVGQWDRFNNAVADHPLIVGDTMLFYYSGRTRRHGGYDPSGRSDTGPPWSGIGIATMKLDRFASLSASFDGGSFTTKPLLWPAGKQLFLNANCRWGTIDVELRTPGAQRPVQAARLEGRDEIKLPVALRPPVGDAPAELTVSMHNAAVYAMYWE